jgi:hypothetical protein
MKLCILLTTTVNINYKISPLHLYQNDKQERLDTYLKSIKKWMNTSLPIVVVENSGYTFPLTSSNLEIITFNSNDYEYSKNQMESKGVHEAFSVLYALQHSVFLKNCTHFIKVTGRYFIPSFELQHIPYSCKAIRQHDHERCEIIGCKKSIAKKLFKLPMKIKDTFINHVESVYQHRINQLTNVFTLPILEIEPTLRGCKNEIYICL